MERKVGEVFECDGVKLRVEEETFLCQGCYFSRNTSKKCTSCKRIIGECQSFDRGDSGVIFKKVEDMEERVIKLTLEKAKEFYKKGGEFRDLALSAYTEKELKEKVLPKTWEEFCESYNIRPNEYFINLRCNIAPAPDGYEREVGADKNVLPSKEAAEAHLALMQLHQLRDCYRQGWKPNFSDKTTKYCVKVKDDYVYIYTSMETSCFLSFQTHDIANEFIENFKDLIFKAWDLL